MVLKKEAVNEPGVYFHLFGLCCQCRAFGLLYISRCRHLSQLTASCYILLLSLLL